MKIKSTLKALAKALSSIPERGFRAAPLTLRSIISAAALFLLMAGLFPANAGEPCHWQRKPNNPTPFQFDTFHGETIDFRCTFIGFSSLPFGQSSNPESSNPPIPQSSNAPHSPRLYYQTNGMAAAWWDIPATVSTTVVTNCQPPITNYSLSAVFPPAADPGAERLTVFFGAPSNAYAAAQVRFRNSPGAHPNYLDPPSVLDWQAELSSATNSLAVSLSSQMSQMSQSATNYTDLATNTLLKSFAPTISNTVTKSYVESLGIESGVSTNDVCNIVTNEIITPTTYKIVFTGGASTISPVYISNVVWTRVGEREYCSFAVNGTSVTNETYDGEEGNGIAFTVGSSIIMSDDMNIEFGSTPTEWNLFEVNTFDYASSVYVLPATTENALGLARLTDIAPSVSNTVTNMTALTPVYGGNGEPFREWDYHNLPDGSVFYDDDGISFSDGTWVLRITVGDLPYVGETSGTANDNELEFSHVFAEGDEGLPEYSITATRTENPIIGYTLGNQTNSVLAATNSLISASTATNIAFAVSSNATNSLAKSLAPTITNIASTVSSSAIASADTTYRRTIGLTNINQSVQYVNITDTAPTTLAISMPTDGETKDWMVYVVSVTNVSLSLPSATWWMADTAYTNDVPPAKPTALWFSQVTDGIFILGRQELTEVTAQ